MQGVESCAYSASSNLSPLIRTHGAVTPRLIFIQPSPLLGQYLATDHFSTHYRENIILSMISIIKNRFFYLICYNAAANQLIMDSRIHLHTLAHANSLLFFFYFHCCPICCNTYYIRLIVMCGTTYRFWFKCNIVKIYSNNSITSQIICSFF